MCSVAGAPRPLLWLPFQLLQGLLLQCCRMLLLLLLLVVVETDPAEQLTISAQNSWGV
jgi:hypothetical protein